MMIAEEVALLEHQKDRLKHHILAIQKRKTEFVDPRNVPLDLEEAQIRTLAEIARVEAQLTELCLDELSQDILLFLSALDPDGDGKVQATELGRKLSIHPDQQENVPTALSSLHQRALIGLEIDRQTVWIRITSNGRKTAQKLIERSIVEEGVSPADQIDESSGYLRFRWDLDRLDSQYIQVVQREDIIREILAALEDPSDRRIVLLYGQPRVGKTFILEQLRRAARDKYVPVLIHVNGWASVPTQSDFLRELAKSIRVDLAKAMKIEIPENHLDNVPGPQCTTAFSMFMYQLSRCLSTENKPFLLMFDELEYLAREKTDTLIFEYLLGLVEGSQQVRVIFAGSGDMLDWIESSSQGLWAKGHPIRVDCFEDDVSRRLVESLCSPYFTLESDALDWLIALVDGHPCLMRDLLDIVFHYWRTTRMGSVSKHDLEVLLEELCTGLSGALTDTWNRLRSQERDILRWIAQHAKHEFEMQELVSDTVLDDRRFYRENAVKNLARRQILYCDTQSGCCRVRLGLLVEALSHGVLS